MFWYKWLTNYLFPVLPAVVLDKSDNQNLFIVEMLPEGKTPFTAHIRAHSAEEAERLAILKYPSTDVGCVEEWFYNLRKEMRQPMSLDVHEDANPEFNEMSLYWKMPSKLKWERPTENERQN